MRADESALTGALVSALAVCACESSVVLPGGGGPGSTSTSLIVERLTSSPCMPFSLPTDPSGQLPCIVVEAQRGEPCDCAAMVGRTASSDPVVTEFVREDELTKDMGFECICEIVQLADQPLAACQNDPAASSSGDGWCYIDADDSPPLGNPELVAECPDGDRRGIRFVGAGEIAAGAIAYLACAADG